MKTLRNKITIVVSIILFATMGLLTAYSIINSKVNFAPLLETASDPRNVLTRIEIVGSSTVPPLLNGEFSVDNTENGTDEFAFSLLPQGYSPSVTVKMVQSAQVKYQYTQFLFMFIIVGVGVALIYIYLGKSLKPLKKLNQAAVDIDEHNLNTQIPVPKSNDEVATLTKSFNSMLSRLSGAFAMQRNFSSNAAHELKTPLAVIKTSLQVLNMDDSPTLQDYKENAETISDSTNQLIEIVAQLLTLTEKTDVEQTEISLNSVVEGIVSSHKDDIEEKCLVVTMQVEEVDICSSKTLVKSIVDNVITNAIKYNIYGGSLIVSITREEEIAILTITDSGIGIDDAHIDNIFTPFYRVDESRNKSVDGNGLGLAIVKASLEKIGGSIDVKSQLNVGTSVTIKFPERQYDVKLSNLKYNNDD